MARAVRAGLLGLALGLGGAALADPVRPRGPVVVPRGPANPAYCWPETKIFETLRYGPVDFCRKHLRYRPGFLECAQVGENVCWVLFGGQWTLTRTPTREWLIPCPDGPAPPVCPRMTLR